MFQKKMLSELLPRKHYMSRGSVGAAPCLVAGVEADKSWDFYR